MKTLARALFVTVLGGILLAVVDLVIGFKAEVIVGWVWMHDIPCIVFGGALFWAIFKND